MLSESQWKWIIRILIIIWILVVGLMHILPDYIVAKIYNIHLLPSKSGSFGATAINRVDVYYLQLLYVFMGLTIIFETTSKSKSITFEVVLLLLTIFLGIFHVGRELHFVEIDFGLYPEAKLLTYELVRKAMFISIILLVVIWYIGRFKLWEQFEINKDDIILKAQIIYNKLRYTMVIVVIFVMLYILFIK